MRIVNILRYRIVTFGDVIILLGGGVYDGVPDFSGIGRPSDRALPRVITAARLQKRLNLPVIVCGGAVFEKFTKEAPILKRFLTDLGVSEEKIILEDRSRDTHENAKFTAEICSKMGYKRPILVTSAFHLKRSIPH